MTLPRLHPRQNAIAAVLGVTPPFTNPAMLAAEALRRQVFIEDTLQASGLTTLVLGISGGVDSLVAGRLAQLAVQALRTRTRDGRYRFIAVRLPYGTQHDEDDHHRHATRRGGPDITEQAHGDSLHAHVQDQVLERRLGLRQGPLNRLRRSGC